MLEAALPSTAPPSSPRPMPSLPREVSYKNLEAVAKELGESMSEDQLREMIEYADKSNAGSVSADDFYRLMMKGGQQNKLDDLLDED